MAIKNACPKSVCWHSSPLPTPPPPSTCVPPTGPTEDALVVDVLDAEPQAGWEGAHQDVQVEEERHPGGGLVLRHRGDDGDVDFGIPGYTQSHMHTHEHTHRRRQGVLIGHTH